MNQNDPVCLIFNQTLAIKNVLTKVIQKEHTELSWNYCGKMFRNRSEVDNLLMDEHTELLWNYCGKILRNWKEVDTHIYEACEPISSECTSKGEGKNFNEHIVVEK